MRVQRRLEFRSWKAQLSFFFPVRTHKVAGYLPPPKRLSTAARPVYTAIRVRDREARAKCFLRGWRA